MDTNNNYCRICLDIDNKGEFLDIFSKAQLVHNKTATISTLVKECSSVNVIKKFIRKICFGKNLSSRHSIEIFLKDT